MTAATDDASVAALERALMDAMFSERGRVAPADVARGFPVPGCRHSFVRQVLHDPRFAAPTMPSSEDLMFQTVGRFMSRLPADRHRILRARFAGLFTARRVERYKATISNRVQTLMDQFPSTRSVDLVPAFVRPLPFTVLADVLGVPPDQQPWLSAAMTTFGEAVAGQREHAQVEHGNDATREMLDYFDQTLVERRQQPRDDLLTLLAASDGLPAEAHADLVANCLFFLLAGHATTSSLLAAGLQLLLDHPDQLEVLEGAPELWPTAVDELLRYVSPTTLTGATAATDTVADGCPVAAGTQRTLVFAAANRDPDVFDEPDTFQATRAPNPHLAFSAGAHYCLGAPLARLHAEIALPALLSRLPGLRLTEPPRWLGSVPVRQIGALAVTWSYQRPGQPEPR